jgi:hypothetical protein
MAGLWLRELQLSALTQQLALLKTPTPVLSQASSKALQPTREGWQAPRSVLASLRLPSAALHWLLEGAWRARFATTAG